MSFVFAFLAGVLSILSPCVLPLLPMILGAAISKNRFGIYALALGLALSFVSVGLFIATIGFSLGIDQGIFRIIAAIILLIMGVFLLFPKVFSPISNGLNAYTSQLEMRFGGSTGNRSLGQFLTGVLLGILWIPCVGPTLGAATILAAKGESLFEVTAIMLVFGIGAAVPLLLIGLLAVKNLRFLAEKMDKAKKTFGALLILTALSILTGYDKIIETFLVKNSPDWLTKISTYF
jgi:cytochrome c-type biogenesis protein